MENKIHPTEYSYFEIRRIILSILAKYPFVSLVNLGKSAAGRDIPLLFLGQTNDFTLFVAGDDSTQRINTLILLKFIKELCEKTLSGEELCSINIRKALFGRGLAIIPLLNPDGHEIAHLGERGCGRLATGIGRLCKGDYSKWSANLRGVELKRNFFPDFDKRKAKEKQQNIFGPSFKGFGGYRPESEPETAALAEFCRTKEVRQFVNLSSGGNTIIYGAKPNLPPKSEKMVQVMSAVSSFTVTPPIAREEVELCDWFAYEFQKPAITLKIGEGSSPPCSELSYWYARVKEMLTLSCLF